MVVVVTHAGGDLPEVAHAPDLCRRELRQGQRARAAPNKVRPLGEGRLVCEPPGRSLPRRTQADFVECLSEERGW